MQTISPPPNKKAKISTKENSATSILYVCLLTPTNCFPHCHYTESMLSDLLILINSLSPLSPPPHFTLLSFFDHDGVLQQRFSFSLKPDWRTGHFLSNKERWGAKHKVALEYLVLSEPDPDTQISFWYI